MKSKKNISEEPLPVSKSQRRREALELKTLAADLIKLSPSSSAIPFPWRTQKATAVRRETAEKGRS